MKKLKQALSLTLALVMALVLAVPASAVTEPDGPQALTVAGDDEIYDRILRSLMFQPADRQAVLTLHTDFQLTGNPVILGTSDYDGQFRGEIITVQPHDVVIDLNGYTITSEVDYPIFEVQAGYTLTIIDSSAEKTGKLVAQGETDVVVEEGGKYIPLPVVEDKPAEPEQPETPAQPVGSAVAAPTNDKLTMDGKLQNPTVLKLDGGDNYFKIRDLAAMLNGTSKQFSVGYDGSVQVTTGRPYTPVGGELAGPATATEIAEPSNDVIYINGEKANLTAFKVGGNNFFRLRDLGKALDFYVGWTAERGVFIETDKPYGD